MTNRGTRTKVEILDQEYSIVGEEEKYLQEVAEYVDKQLKQLQEETSQNSSGRLCLLACLNIADQLKKLKYEHKNLVIQLLDTVNKLIGEIDNVIETQQTALK